MRTKHLTVAAIGVVAACTLATACNDGSTDRNTGNEAAGTSASSAAAAPQQHNGPNTGVQPSAPTANNGSTATGTIVLSFCPSASKGIREVEFIDPKTSAETARPRQFPFEPMKYTSAADCNSNLRGPLMRSVFNRDFSEVGAENDIWHTGVISAGHDFQSLTTKFTDLATGLNGGSPVSTIQQSSGAFGPDGWLYFVEKRNMGDEAKLMKVNPTNGRPKVAKTTTDLSGFDPTESGSQLFFTPGGGPLTDNSTYQVFSPDGKQFFRGGDGTITYGKTYGKTVTTDPNYGHTVWPVIYISSEKFIAITETGLIRVTVDGKKLSEQQIIPVTSNKIIDPMLSPDGGTIAYFEESDSTRTLYTVPTDGGPRHKVMDLDRTLLGVGILDWTTGK